LRGYSETKWTKYHILRKSARVARTLPRTRIFNRQTLLDFLARYRQVIAKPIAGSGGAGVLMVTGLGGGRFRVHRGAIRRIVRGKQGAYRFVRSRIRSRYIVQQGISLARANGRPFDVRVMVQRRPGKPWTVTGYLAKVAGPGYIITNIKRSRGRVLPLATAIRRSNIRGASADVLIGRLKQVALAAAVRLSTYYRKQRVFGFDMGIDAHGKVWIIEANLRPDISLFLKLADKTMYKRIVSFRQA
jgi:hypothetical protein